MKYGCTRTSAKDKQDDELQRHALVAEGAAARTVGWSNATYYRHRSIAGVS
ncbi:hypothetical protein LVY72_13990 [Arthrobacter sp. I2-34]|uniref:Uncharacterized protein n=1 Tax=Arthrobacter hankyongi TaxID=2904801 RepID=A0ABS9L966_9MICC|nr:hypothetical protein [Arthrobacter hankyongi]MCG2623009.1 hypothetical protein [Arthrobacter hankyongi]